MAAPSLVVVKIGSSTLVDAAGALDRAFVRELCDQVGELLARGTRVVLVSSGAVAAGRDVLGFSERPSDLATLQACAAAGQARLTQAYADVLAEASIPCAQVLLTRRDVMDRDAFLSARTTLGRLLELGAVPVINENDTLSTAEFAFGDNDMLGALVSALVSADLYVICSDVEGLYTANPQDDPEAVLIERVEEVDHELSSRASGAGTSFGTGGMSSKLPRRARHARRGHPDRSLSRQAAARPHRRRLRQAGGHALRGGPGRRARGRSQALDRARRGPARLDHARRGREPSRAGARRLDPSVGVVASSGSYEAGDVVNVRDASGDVIGRGIARYSSDDMVRVRGVRLDVIARFLGADRARPAVHRDDLLVF